MKKLATSLLVLALVGVFLSGCDETDSTPVRGVYDALSPGMTKAQVGNVVGAPHRENGRAWVWTATGPDTRYPEEVTVIWEKGQIKEVHLSEWIGDDRVSKRKPPATPAAAEKPKTSTEPPAQPAEPVSSTGTTAETVKECRADCPTRTTACATNGCTCPGGCLVEKE